MTSFYKSILDSLGLMSKLAKWLYVGMAVFSFPLMIAPAKTVLSNLSPFHLNQSTSTVIIVIISFLLGLFIKDLSVVLETISISSVHTCFFRFQLGSVYLLVFQFAICYLDIFIITTLTKIPQVIKISK